LAGVLKGISATHGPSIRGFLGSIVHEGVDSPDGLVEIAEWDSVEEQAAAVAQAMASGLYAPGPRAGGRTLQGHQDHATEPA
jgi:hypothetical protein